MGTVRVRVDPGDPPRMTAEERARLEAMSDDDIDYSDIPELDDDFWRNAKRVDPTRKATVELELSKDATAWLAAHENKVHLKRVAQLVEVYVQEADTNRSAGSKRRWGPSTVFGLRFSAKIRALRAADTASYHVGGWRFPLSRGNRAVIASRKKARGRKLGIGSSDG